jgi:hypothetical protein
MVSPVARLELRYTNTTNFWPLDAATELALVDVLPAPAVVSTVEPMAVVLTTALTVKHPAQEPVRRRDW